MSGSETGSGLLWLELVCWPLTGRGGHIATTKEIERTRRPGGPAGDQRRNGSKAGVIDAARRGKARAKDGRAQAPRVNTDAGLRRAAREINQRRRRGQFWNAAATTPARQRANGPQIGARPGVRHKGRRSPCAPESGRVGHCAREDAECTAWGGEGTASNEKRLSVMRGCSGSRMSLRCCKIR